MTKVVYRKGDIVRVVNSRFVKRIGYPLMFKDLIPEFENHPRLEDALRLVGVLGEHNRLSGRVLRDAVEGLAKAAVRARGWGGKERRIHYFETAIGEQLEDLWSLMDTHRADATGHKAEVYSKSVRQTGDYYPPWYGGDDDYEPGGLTNMKAHVILSTSLGDIEARNVELVRAAERTS